MSEWSSSNLDVHAVPSGERKITMPVRVLAGFGMMAVMYLGWYVSKGNWASVGIIASILSAFWLAFEKIFPYGFENRISVYQAIRYATFIFVPGVFIFCIYSISDLRFIHSYPGFSRFLPVIFSALFISTIFVILLCIWRGYLVQYLNIRGDLTLWLISYTHRAISELNRNSNDGVRNLDEFYHCLQEILDKSCFALQLNPSEKLQKTYLSGKQYYGLVSLWYLEPKEGRL